jgi:hypothetical protein
VKDGRLRHAPDELRRPEAVVEVGEGARREAVPIVGKGAFLELVAHDGRDPDFLEHDARLPDRGAHHLQRRGALRRGVGVDQDAELGRDASGRAVDGVAKSTVDAGARLRRQTVPRVEDAGGPTEEILGEVRLDAGDDGGAGVAETRPGLGVVGQASSPTRRRASTGSRTRPVTNGPNSA